jgi:hypothetical protein
MGRLTRYGAEVPAVTGLSKTLLTPAMRRAGGNAVAIDAALLFSALFLQRFTLPFGNTFLMLDMVPVALILSHQFAAGNLFIQYDRLWWYLAVVATATCALLLNFNRDMLTSYFLFLVLYSFVILIRPSTVSLYKGTLRVFQLLVMILSGLAVFQFIAQFALDGRQLIMFYGLVPDFLLGFFYAGGENTIHPLFEGSSILKSNGLFLTEPSALSQITATGILIEVLEFGRPLCLLIMALGFLVAYSGTGLFILAFLPLAGLRDRKAGFSVVLVVLCALALFATGIIDLSQFSDRVGEFSDPNASGFIRFVAPIWLAARQFDTAPLLSLLVGNGPGTSKVLNHAAWLSAFDESWFKLFLEYGIIGLVIFLCFLASCFRRSQCPRILLAALVANFIFNVGFLTTSYVTLIVVLCTLSGPESKQVRARGTGWQEPVSGPRSSSRSASVAI